MEQEQRKKGRKKLEVKQRTRSYKCFDCDYPAIRELIINYKKSLK